ncbi:hypothetical protein AZE42_11062 [Rhizopogon vesiculosus]|uniref:Uncharacterized protein n=1 Tax=Rhizopogon vesiculosus TaxID=180088 RepID=A0A1J8R5K5_9AGAM|nr:hypothetical protein AZE42_11062 [Rhizopogon vesiculosus]
MAHLHANSVTIQSNSSSRPTEHRVWQSWGGMNRFIRETFLDANRACDQRKNTEQDARAKDEVGALVKDEADARANNEADARANNEADARSALRTILVHGRGNYLVHPDEEYLIWYGDFRWRHSNGNTPSSEEFQWLIDYLVEKVDDGTDPETEGDALLALSAMHGLGSSTKRPSYVKALTRCMAPTRFPRVRYAALRVVSEAREELASMTNSDPATLGVDATLLDGLSDALLTGVRTNHNQTMQESISDANSAGVTNYLYLRLIFALQKNDEWCKRLASGGHLEECNSSSLYDIVLASPHFLDKVYLAGILLRVDPSSNDISPKPTREKWWTLIQRAWSEFYLLPWDSNLQQERIIEALQALVTMTRQDLPGPNNFVASTELAELKKSVNIAMYYFKHMRRYSRPKADVGLDGAVLTVQCLYDDLSSYIASLSENGHTPRGDNRLLES